MVSSMAQHALCPNSASTPAKYTLLLISGRAPAPRFATSQRKLSRFPGSVRLHTLVLPGVCFQRHRQQQFLCRPLPAIVGEQAESSSLQDTQYEVTIRKPLGLVLGERQGAVVVEEVVPGGNAAKTGQVAVGDVLAMCSATVLKEGSGDYDEKYQSQVHGQALWTNWSSIMFDCTGQDFKTVMSAISSNNERWGIFSVKLVFDRPVQP